MALKDLGEGAVTGMMDLLKGGGNSGPIVDKPNTEPAPAPTPTPTPEPAPNPSPTPTPAPSPTPTPTPAAGAPAPSPTPIPEPFDYKALGFSSVDDIKTLRQQYEEQSSKLAEQQARLQQLQKYENGPEFKSERHKLLYELTAATDGLELTKAQQMLHIASLDLKSLPDQQTRFEAFKLSAEAQNLTQEELMKLFAHKEKAYLSPEGDPDADIRKIEEKQATARSREVLVQEQDKWNKARAAEPAVEQVAVDRAKIQQEVVAALSNFDGIRDVALTALDDKGEKIDSKINYIVDKATQLPVIIDAAQNPDKWLLSKLEQFGAIDLKNPNSPMNYAAFAKFVSLVEFAEQRQALTYQQGVSDGILQKIKSSKQLDPTPTPGSGAPAPTPPKPVSKGTISESVAKAAQDAGLF